MRETLYYLILKDGNGIEEKVIVCANLAAAYREQLKYDGSIIVKVIHPRIVEG